LLTDYSTNECSNLLISDFKFNINTKKKNPLQKEIKIPKCPKVFFIKPTKQVLTLQI